MQRLRINASWRDKCFQIEWVDYDDIQFIETNSLSEDAKRSWRDAAAEIDSDLRERNLNRPVEKRRKLETRNFSEWTS